MMLNYNLPPTDLEEIVNRTSNIASKLAYSKILITGSTGFIGLWLTNALLMLDHKYNLEIEFFLTSRNIKKSREKLYFFQKNRINFLEIDYLTNESLPKIEVSHIVFSSTPSQPSTGGDNISIVEKVSKNSFNSLVEVAKNQKIPPIFCNLSSGAVYGKKNLNQGKIREQGLLLDARAGELNEYAKIKFELELEIEVLTNLGQIRGTNPRLFAFAGPGISLEAHFAIGNFMKNAIKGEEIFIKGNPNTQRSYLYPTDLNVWLLNLLVNPTINPTHIGSENLVSISHLAEKISEMFSAPGVSAGDDSAELSFYAPETSKTREHLNVSEEVSLDESIMRWKNWLTSQPG
jgi:nucleoside-diphosphate-sugar epimerase